MHFLMFVLLVAVVWLLWVISRNTGDALDKQTAIQYELVSLEKKLEQLSETLSVQSVPEKKKAVSSKKSETSVLNHSKVSGAEVDNVIDINNASLKEIISLPKIGKALAQRIVDARPYVKADDLLGVQGISKEMFSEIKSLIVVS
jgi:competence protein ComEA